MDRITLNLGCGFDRMEDAINVDKYDICEPDMVWDLDIMPWPWEDNSIEEIYMNQVLEHLQDWWEVLRECGRILKVGGSLFVSVPDEGNSNALAYRDHKHVFTWMSFYKLEGSIERMGRNAFAADQVERYGKIPLRLTDHTRTPFPQYWWMAKWCPWLLSWCVSHLRNICTSQNFIFLKING